MAVSTSSGGITSNPTYETSVSLQAAPTIITFIPNRAAPLYTHVQNDSRLAHSYDPLSIQPVPPPSCERTDCAALPARYEPLPPPAQIAAQGHRRCSVAIAHRAQELQAQKPTEDEILLERLKRS
jgi:hypothetical protein